MAFLKGQTEEERQRALEEQKATVAMLRRQRRNWRRLQWHQYKWSIVGVSFLVLLIAGVGYLVPDKRQTIAVSQQTRSGGASPVCHIVRLGNAPMAMVARSGKLSEAMALLQANETMEAAQCCVACMPDMGTKVLITERGFMSHTIRVLDGKFKGCTGDVVIESVGDCQ